MYYRHGHTPVACGWRLRPSTTIVTCKYCNTEIADKALICYRCGHATTEPRVTPPSAGSLFEGRRRSRGPIIAAVIAVIVLILVVWFLLGGETVPFSGAQLAGEPASIIAYRGDVCVFADDDVGVSVYAALERAQSACAFARGQVDVPWMML